MEYEAVVASLWGPHCLPDGLQSNQEARAAGQILSSLRIYLQSCECTLQCQWGTVGQLHKFVLLVLRYSAFGKILILIDVSEMLQINVISVTTTWLTYFHLRWKRSIRNDLCPYSHSWKHMSHFCIRSFCISVYVLWYIVHVPDFVSLQFPDAKSGEWFGYLTQEGEVALDFKGGPFKGEIVI